MPKEVILYGAGYPDSVKIIHALSRAGLHWNIKGFLDDLPEKQGGTFLDYPILGDRELLADLRLGESYFFNNVYSTTSARRQVSQRMIENGCRFATFIHPNVNSEFVQIGEDSIVSEGAKLGAQVTIGKHCAIRINAMINHDCTLEDFVFVGGGAILGGYVKVETGAFIGMGAIVKERVCIGKGSTVGAGAVVVQDVEPFTRVAGVPARVLPSKSELDIELRGNHGSAL